MPTMPDRYPAQKSAMMAECGRTDVVAGNRKELPPATSGPAMASSKGPLIHAYLLSDRPQLLQNMGLAGSFESKESLV